MKNIFVQSHLEKITRMLADRYNLVVRFEGGAPRTDGKTITLPAFSDQLSEKEQRDLLSHTCHEIGHILYTGFTTGTRFAKAHGPKAFEILNSLEDIRVESLFEQEYLGAKQLFQDTIIRYTDRCERENVIPDPFRLVVSCLYLIGRGYEIPKHWDDGLVNIARDFNKEIAQVIRASNTKKVANIALVIWKKLQALDEAAKQQQQQLQQKAGPGNNDNTMQQSGDKSQDLSDDVENSGQDSESGDDTGKLSDSTDSESSGKDLSQSTKSDTSGNSVSHSSDGPGNNTPVLCDPDDHLASSSAGNPRDAITQSIKQSCDAISQDWSVYKKYSKDKNYDWHVTPKPAPEDTTRELELSVTRYVNALRAKLISALIAETKTRWLSEQEDGLIDSNRLYALTSGSSERIFKQRFTGKSKSTACSLVIDCSCSMTTYRMALARAVAYVFSDALSKANIKTRITGFDSNETLVPSSMSRRQYQQLRQSFSQVAPVRFYHVKDFHESHRQAKPRFASLDSQGFTPLAPVLMAELRELLQRPEARKVMFVLTDGEPNCDGAMHYGKMVRTCREMVVLGERAGVEIIGVGIAHDVSEVFPRNLIINNLDELPKAFVRELYKTLTNRKDVKACQLMN